MKIIIDLVFLRKVKLTVNEYLTLIIINSPEKNIPYKGQKIDYLSLDQKELIKLVGSTASITARGLEILEGIAELRPYEDLVEELRVLYPQGKKSGKWPWRGYSRDILVRLKKLDKSAGLDKYTNADLINAVKEYVGQFTLQDMDRGMQLLQYFIEKDGNSTLIAWLESDDKETLKTSSMDMRL